MRLYFQPLDINMGPIVGLIFIFIYVHTSYLIPHSNPMLETSSSNLILTDLKFISRTVQYSPHDWLVVIHGSVLMQVIRESWENLW